MIVTFFLGVEFWLIFEINCVCGDWFIFYFSLICCMILLIDFSLFELISLIQVLIMFKIFCLFHVHEAFWLVFDVFESQRFFAIFNSGFGLCRFLCFFILTFDFISFGNTFAIVWCWIGDWWFLILFSLVFLSFLFKFLVSVSFSDSFEIFVLGFLWGSWVWFCFSVSFVSEICHNF